MKATERPDIASAYIQRIRELVGGVRKMPEVNYGDRDNEVIHLSDVTEGNCLAQAFYRLMASKRKAVIPEISDSAALYFLRGRVVERSISEEIAPKECDGIVFTLDGFHPAYNLYVEIKSTAMGQTNFEPFQGQDAWWSRIMGYCHALGVKSMALVVIFICGDSASFKKPKDGIKKKVGLRAWVLDFDDAEIEGNWNKILCSKKELEDALESGVLNPLAVTPQKWECPGCVWQPTCQYTNVKTP
jgi:hypothetical protein